MIAGSVLTDTIEVCCNPVDEAQPSHFYDESHHIPNYLSLASVNCPFKQGLGQPVLLLPLVQWTPSGDCDRQASHLILPMNF